MKPILIYLLAGVTVLFACTQPSPRLQPSPHDLQFTDLASNWDGGMPLGNGMVGALVWQKDSMLRLSLDCVELWDERPMVNKDSLSTKNFNWVEQQVRKNDYRLVQLMYDVPYDTSAFPTKLPGAALEFNIQPLGPIDTVRLYLNNAVNLVTWKNGSTMYSFVHPTEPIGWFKFEQVGPDFLPVLVPPTYDTPTGIANDPVGGHDLRRLGYKQGEVIARHETIEYTQQGWNGFSYQVAVQYRKTKTGMEGVWSISTEGPASSNATTAKEQVAQAMQRGYAKDFATLQAWWETYWKQSSITIPDSVLAKQYYNELYKFGSAARSYSPPISLQAVWTADNGKLPPWKGDYHHDLNTQLSYWHAYTANRLTEGLGYLNWLIKVKETNKRYTKEYFGTDGLAVPGVTTLGGEPMAGWIQYSFSPTVSSWLVQHFYLHWLYSKDKEFLQRHAYPYMKDVLTFLDQLAIKDGQGKRSLPISASPEIYDNSQRAWFFTTTNYDLALVRFAYTAGIDMAKAQGLMTDAKQWETTLAEWPDFDLDAGQALSFAKGFPYNESHRHFSNLMAIYPLGLIDVSQGKHSTDIIKASIHLLDSLGPSNWTGYSYSWLANLKARALDGDGASRALQIFAEHFCLRNTFHANGDQTKMGYSSFTYSPFTLEGNFAFAAGVQEMLIQSHTGTIQLFPAIPSAWKDVSFHQLRTVGAFLVSAEMKDGKVSRVRIKAEKGGDIRLKKTFGNYSFQGTKTPVDINGVLVIGTTVGEEITLNCEIR